MNVSDPKRIRKTWSYEVEVEVNGKTATFTVEVNHFYNSLVLKPNTGYITELRQVRPCVRFSTSQKKAIRKAIEEKIANINSSGRA